MLWAAGVAKAFIPATNVLTSLPMGPTVINTGTRERRYVFTTPGQQNKQGCNRLVSLVFHQNKGAQVIGLYPTNNPYSIGALPKTDLLMGFFLSHHTKSIVMRDLTKDRVDWPNCQHWMYCFPKNSFASYHLWITVNGEAQQYKYNSNYECTVSRVMLFSDLAVNSSLTRSLIVVRWVISKVRESTRSGL